MHFSRCVKNLELHRRQGATKSVIKSTNWECQNKHVTPEEKRRFLARRAQETKQRRALFNAETDAEEI